MDGLVIPLSEEISSRPSAHARFRDSYFGRAFLHPLHGVALVAICALSSGLGLGVALVLVESLMLGLLPRSSWFQRRVNEQRRALEDRKQSDTRMLLLNRMRDDDRIEFMRLDQLVTAIKARIGRSGISKRVLDDYMRLERLLMVYAQLAASYADSDRLLGLTDRADADDFVDGDSPAQPQVFDSARVRNLAERRQAVARLRAATAEENAEALHALRGELGLIGDLVTLLFERTATPVVPGEIAEEIDRYVSGLDETGPLVRELITLRAV